MLWPLRPLAGLQGKLDGALAGLALLRSGNSLNPAWAHQIGEGTWALHLRHRN